MNQGNTDLPHKMPGDAFGHPPMAMNIGSKIPSSAVLQNQVYLVLSLLLNRL